MLDHTFVILAYKESEFLESCIQSVLSQTVKSNVIIATSTPNDFIKSIAIKYQISVIVNSERNGIGGDFDFAINVANTTYVTIAHQDDIYEPHYLEEISKHFQKNVIIIYSHYAEIRNGESVYSNKLLNVKKIMNFILKYKFFQTSSFIRRRILSIGNSICCPAVTYNKEKVETPLFLSDFLSNVDWYAWEKLSRQNGKFVYIEKPLMLHRVHSESTTSDVIKYGRGEEDYRIYRLFWPPFIAKLLLKQYSRAEKSNKL